MDTFSPFPRSNNSTCISVHNICKLLQTDDIPINHKQRLGNKIIYYIVPRINILYVCFSSINCVLTSHKVNKLNTVFKTCRLLIIHKNIERIILPYLYNLILKANREKTLSAHYLFTLHFNNIQSRMWKIFGLQSEHLQSRCQGQDL